MNPSVLRIVRYVLMGLLLLFSLITLGLSGHVISGQSSAGFTIPDFLGLALAVSVITMVVVVPVNIIDFLRKGAFSSMVVFELAWSFVLTVLWIASAGASTDKQASASCKVVIFDPFSGAISGEATALEGRCREAKAIIAFGWLNFFILLGWSSLLLVLAIMSHSRGNTGVWTQSVVGTDFFARKQGYGQSPAQYGGVPQNPYGAPPMQQQQHTGVPMQPQFTGASGQPYNPPMQQQQQYPQQPFTPPLQQQQATYPPSGYNTAQV